VVVEPTGRVAAGGGLLRLSGHTVYRVPSAKALDLRRLLSRLAKSNQIDPDRRRTVARLPLVDPRGLQPLELPGSPRASLHRLVRTASG
jgi:hypothetical protein